MREVVAIARPAEIPEHDLAESCRPRAELEAAHPERIANRRAGSLAAHRLNAAKEELLLDRELTAGRAATERERTIERAAEPVRESRLQRGARIVERARRSFKLEIGQRAESVRIESVRGMMSNRQSNDLSVQCIDVREATLHSAGMRNRELRVHRRVEVLLREQTPIVDQAVVLVAFELRTPRPVVESFVAPEQQCRQRAAEAEWIAPVVRGGETPIDTDSYSPSTIGAGE